LAPFTTDEAWSTRFPDGGFNALRVIPAIQPEWENTAELERWRKIQGLLMAVNSRLEGLRTDKVIGSSLEAYVNFAVDHETHKAFEGIVARDVFRTSAAKLEVDPAVSGGSYALTDSGLAEGHKCDRCWKVLTEVDPAEKLCGRCVTVVANWGAK
jgi:isoleucyl-tRNA synthetase